MQIWPRMARVIQASCSPRLRKKQRGNFNVLTPAVSSSLARLGCACTWQNRFDRMRKRHAGGFRAAADQGTGVSVPAAVGRSVSGGGHVVALLCWYGHRCERYSSRFNVGTTTLLAKHNFMILVNCRVRDGLRLPPGRRHGAGKTSRGNYS